MSLLTEMKVANCTFNSNELLCVMCRTSEGEVLVQLPVQLGGGTQLSRMGVDGEEVVARPGQQAVPHRSILFCGRETDGQCWLQVEYCSHQYQMHGTQNNTILQRLPVFA